MNMFELLTDSKYTSIELLRNKELMSCSYIINYISVISVYKIISVVPIKISWKISAVESVF